MKISFVIPCYCSELTIKNVISEIQEICKPSDHDFEIIAVNDYSPDNVLKMLNDITAENFRIKVIDLAKKCW